MDNNQHLLERFVRLSKAATIAAASSTDDDVRATFAALAVQWRSLADLIVDETSISPPKSVSLGPVGEVRKALETLDPAATFGITRIPTHYFQYKTFRYGNFEDAVAQVERDQPLSSITLAVLATHVVAPSAWAKPGSSNPGIPNSAHEWT